MAFVISLDRIDGLKCPRASSRPVTFLTDALFSVLNSIGPLYAQLLQACSLFDSVHPWLDGSTVFNWRGGGRVVNDNRVKEAILDTLGEQSEWELEQLLLACDDFT